MAAYLALRARTPIYNAANRSDADNSSRFRVRRSTSSAPVTFNPSDEGIAVPESRLLVSEEFRGNEPCGIPKIASVIARTFATMRPAPREKKRRGRGHAINTAINRRHKSPALLPLYRYRCRPRYRIQVWISNVRMTTGEGAAGGGGRERETRARVEAGANTSLRSSCRTRTHGCVSIRGGQRGGGDGLDNALVIPRNADTSRRVSDEAEPGDPPSR